MTYEQWEAEVPVFVRNDPLWTVAAYRKSLFLADLSWPDVTKLISDRRTLSLADQLYRAAGSVGANIAEGYSRRGRTACGFTSIRSGLREKRVTGTTRVVISWATRSSVIDANSLPRSFVCS